MAYQINYTPEDAQKFPKMDKKNTISRKYWILALLFVSALYLKHYGIPDLLIPGDKETTKQAVQTMISDMESGESLDNAITEFCMEIIHSAE